jgi:hypothetical protein
MRLAGIAAAAQIGGLTPGLTIAFDLVNPQAVTWAKANAARLIKDISSETRDAVRQAIARSMAGNLTVQQVARYVREIVGLTAKQEQAVYSFYERAIESGYADADALTEANAYAEKLRRYRSEVIARTEVLHAENRGQELLWEQAKAAGGLRGLVRMWLATADEIRAKCEICTAMDRKTTPIGEPWLYKGEEFDSPQDSHPQCLPGNMRVIADSVTGATKRWYSGEVVILRVSGRHELRVTPNHPILTPRGWVAAGALHEGDEVVCHRLGQWEVRADHHDVEMPPMIEDVAGTFRESPGVFATQMPVTAVDFHGDGAGSEVAVVWADGYLRSHLKIPEFQPLRKVALVGADVGRVPAEAFPGRGHSHLGDERLGRAAHSRVRRSRLSHSGGVPHVSPLQPLRFGLPSGRDAQRGEAMHDDRAGHLEPVRQTEDGFTSMVAIEQPSDGGPRVAHDTVIPDGNAEAFEMWIEEGVVDAGLTHEWDHPLACHVTINKLLHVGRAQFTGHVYNLETSRGWYVAESIIAHNCRCSEGLVRAT